MSRASWGKVVFVFLSALSVPAHSSPTQRGRPYDPFEAALVEAKLQGWENEVGGVDCSGACPGGPNCCGRTVMQRVI